MKTLRELLENRHDIYLKWVEPTVGKSVDSNIVTVHLTLEASVHDCINKYRYDHQCGAMKDCVALSEFIVVNWATCVDKYGDDETISHADLEELVYENSAPSWMNRVMNDR